MISHRKEDKREMDIIIWLFLGFILIAFSVVVFLRGVFQRSSEPGEELDNRIAQLEKRVEKLENNRE